MRCVSLEQLADWVEHRLGDGERAAVEVHLAGGCARCRANGLWLQRLYELTAADSTPDPPGWLVKRAVASFVNQPAAPAKAGLHPLVARLVFDSFARLSYEDLRKLGESGRQLVYQAGAYDIDLRFLPSEDIRYENAIGQVLGRQRDFMDVAGLRVAVYRGKRKVATAETNAIGVFNVYHLPQGTYDLKILLPGGEIHIPGATTSSQGG